MPIWIRKLKKNLYVDEFMRNWRQVTQMALKTGINFFIIKEFQFQMTVMNLHTIAAFFAKFHEKHKTSISANFIENFSEQNKIPILDWRRENSNWIIFAFLLSLIIIEAAEMRLTNKSFLFFSLIVKNTYKVKSSGKYLKKNQCKSWIFSNFTIFLKTFSFSLKSFEKFRKIQFRFLNF